MRLGAKLIRDIQLLRGLAVLFVIVAHLPGPYPGVVPSSVSWLGWWTGVDIFFAVSGYVIARSFLPRIEGERNKMRAAVAFWIRRLYRLLPAGLFWASLLVVLAFVFNSTGIFGTGSGVLAEYVSVLLHVKNIAALYMPSYSMGPYWSLALEEQFYFLLPLIVIFLPSLARPLGIFFLLSVLLTCTVVYEPVMQYFRASPILAGILIYQLSLSDLHSRFEPRFMANRQIRVLVLASLFAALLVASSWASGYRWVVITSVAAALVFLASYNKGYVSLPVVGKFVEWMGDRSYSAYVAHMPMLLLAYEVGHRVGVTNAYYLAAAAIAMICAAAAVSYAVLETPLQQRGRARADAYLRRYRGPEFAASAA